MSDYITLSELKNSLELTNTSYADNELRMAIPAASRGVDEYCGRTFSTGGTADVRYFTPYDPRVVEVDDLISATTVESDYNGDGVYETTWATTDYVLEPANAPSLSKPYETLRVYPLGNQRLTLWPNSVKITGQFGWGDPPAGVKQATMIMATRLVQRARQAPFGVVGVGFDNISVRIPSVDPDVRFLLEPYVKGGGIMVA